MRILITGSRAWTDLALIAETLYQHDPPTGPRPTLVSGACPDGADHLCEQVAYGLGWKVERHPADWDHHGKGAGFVRNLAMVELGADLCLAFVVDRSKGATMTADLADKAGIHTRRFETTSVD